MSWPAWRPVLTTTSPSRSSPRSSQLAYGPCCAGPGRRAGTRAIRVRRSRDPARGRRRAAQRRGGPLTRTEFLLLCELAANPGKVLCREQLLERVWGYDYFGDGRLVDVHVRRLRTKIENDPSEPRHVLTVRGLGYKLAP